MAQPERSGRRYAADFTAEGRADMDALAPAPRRAAWRMLRRLQIDPYGPDSKQLRGQPEGKRRAAVGRWRIIYQVDQAGRTFTVQRVKPRETIYLTDLAWPPNNPDKQ